MEEFLNDYFCIYGGGSVRGLAYIGVMKALDELKINRTGFAGSSVGAIFATLDALGYKYSEIENDFLDINFGLFKDINFSFNGELAISKGEVFYNKLKELIESKFYGEEYKKGENEPVCFKDLDVDLVIITSKLDKAEYNEFSRYTTPDFEIAKAIRISTTVPGLMIPLEYENSTLSDGDMLKTSPMWKLSNSMCPDKARILEFRLEGNINENTTSIFNHFNLVIDCVSAYAAKYIEEQYKSIDKFDYIILNTKDVPLFNLNISKEKRIELIELGYNETIDYFKNKIIIKKRILQTYYQSLLSHIEKIKTNMEKKQYKLVEVELGKLFMTLLPIKKYVDLPIVDLINEFKDCFFRNLKKNLLGFLIIYSEEFLKTQINYIFEAITKKIIDIENYENRLGNILNENKTL